MSKQPPHDQGANAHAHGLVLLSEGPASDECVRTAFGEVRGHGCPLVLDLSAVPSPSSSTIALLLKTQRECRRDGVSLVLCGLSRQGRRLFRQTGLADVFDVGDGSARAR